MSGVHRKRERCKQSFHWTGNENQKGGGKTMEGEKKRRMIKVYYPTLVKLRRGRQSPWRVLCSHWVSGVLGGNEKQTES